MQSGNVWRLVSKVNKVVRLSRGSANLSIFLIHGVGGDLNGLDDLARQIGPEYTVYGIQASMLDMEVDKSKTIDDLAAEYTAFICSASKHKDIVVGGYSSGSVIALAVADRLKSVGRHVPLLIAIDGAPCNTRVSQSFWSVASITSLGRQLRKRTFCANLRSIANSLDLARYDKIAPKDPMIDRGSLIRLFNKGLNDTHKAYIKAIISAVYNYQPPYYNGNVLILESDIQPLLENRQVGRVWKAIASHSKCIIIPGDHGSIATSNFKTIKCCADAIRAEIGDFIHPFNQINVEQSVCL